MAGVLTGFVTLAVVVLLGYLLARWEVLGAGADAVLSRLTFFAATPALMFRTVSEAEVADVFSAGALVNVLTTAVLVLVYTLVARVVLRRRGAGLTLGALSASYVNAGNLGIPLLVFAVGNAAAIAPVLLFQLLVMVPVSFALLDAQTGRRGVSLTQTLSMPVRNPLVIGVALGLLVSLTGVTLPEVVALPVDLVANMAIPVMLIAFGLSLRGAPLPGRGDERAPLWTAVALKALGGPALAYVLGAHVFDLAGADLLGPVIVAALPTAQNVFVYAMRYGRAVPVVRDAVLLTTLGCVPVVLALVAALG
ncbi:AEC family transporter [Georgenia sp. EYE_87]|uniref:AEC family transporter n=1 Tax=Georgenia sp. EYE_87 TaxID=2853448 RepID=UPI002006D71F|nr:AEC family transporter [Georgenia sp. EYE_87]MCK6209704.1 AEC family transporter [Georgenia sp. EYE_87]